MDHASIVFWWAFGGILGCVAAFAALTVLLVGLLAISGALVRWADSKGPKK